MNWREGGREGEANLICYKTSTQSAMAGAGGEVRQEPRGEC